MDYFDLKTIDIATKTWFDRVNGNTYFAQRIVLNYGYLNEVTYVNKFQYGYSSFEYFALEFLMDKISNFEFSLKTFRDFQKRGIIIRHNISEGRKKDLLTI